MTSHEHRGIIENPIFVQQLIQTNNKKKIIKAQQFTGHKWILLKKCQ